MPGRKIQNERRRWTGLVLWKPLAAGIRSAVNNLCGPSVSPIIQPATKSMLRGLFVLLVLFACVAASALEPANPNRSEEHTSELQSLRHLVCRLLLEKKK